MDRCLYPVIHQIQQRWQEAPSVKGGFGSQTRPLSDPLNQLPFHLTSLGAETRVVAGTIVDVVPRSHCYKVLVENGRSFVVATPLSAATCSEVGARSIGMLQPGTRVWLLLHPQISHAFIIGAEPPYGAAVGGLLPGMISQASRTCVDQAWTQPLRMANNQVIDWSAGRPLDGIPGYEQGWITATGLKVTIDDFMLQFAVNEHCGVFGFYHDSLLRIAGIGLQIWAAAAEQEWLNDAGEAYEYKGSTPYPWEHAGQFQPKIDPATVRTSQQFLVDEPEFSHFEPKSPNSKAFHRTQQYGGYLGQGSHEFVVLPPPDATSYEYGAGPPLTGVYEQFVGLDGRFALRSAKGVTISKRLIIPVPRQLVRPEDPQGDTAENYKFAGVFGDGPTETITGDVATTDDHPSLQRAAGVLELQAYIFNYQGLHPFQFHTKDWQVPDESELQYQSQLPPAFRELATKQYLSSPVPIELQVDHRYGKQNYYQTESALSLLDDGAIVLYDGFGSELKMVAGSSVLSAPGDIWIKAGRNIHLWAGDSIDMRAKNNIDLSTSNEDIRLKSERNMLLLSGNSGAGGTLLESRGSGSDYNFDAVGAPQFGGIALRATSGNLTAWAAEIYARSTVGPLVLDANQGQGVVVINSGSEIHAVGQSIQFLYGTNGEVTRADQFSANSKILSGSLVVGGQTTIDGPLLTNGSILVAGGHIATEGAAAASYFVAPLTGISLSQVHTAVAEIEDTVKNALPTSGTATYESLLTTPLYSGLRAGSEETLQKSQFTFRTDDQYGTSDFQIYEDRWQHMASAAGSTTPWKETAVVSAVGTTYPYPGQQAFEGKTLLQQSELLVSAETGNAADRSSEAYISPTLKKSTAVSLQEYPVIH
jgi:hypothetical protein